MTNYVYVEYPKCLYRDTETVTVQSREEEDLCAKDGWVTAEVFHSRAPATNTIEVKKKKK